MAKAKSKKITIEDALVPVDEQPYEVPENWCWTRVKMLGKEFFDGDWILGENMDPNGKVRLLQLSDIGIGEFLDKSDKHISENTFEKLGCTALHQGDVMISRMAEPIARSCIVPEFDYPVITAVDVAVLRCREELVDNRYLNYLCNAKWFTDVAMSLARGTTRTRITRNNLGDMAVPLPPLPEQQRIVEQIERLFSKLDEAKEKAQEALDSFEERRVAILHKAFEGELTLQWRAEHGVDMSSWRDVPLKDCGRWFGGGTPTTSKKEYWEGGDIPWITSKDMKDRIIEDSLMHITMTGVENSSANYCEEPAILFVMRSGILRRVFPVCMVKRPFTVNQDLKACVPDGILQEYLFWYCTGFEKDIRDNCMKSGTTVESVEAKKLFDYSIRVAGADEQKEIVNRIEAMLDKEAAAYEAAEEVIENIEVVKKSVLARAFRGELGTNDSSEESSIELLKQIIANE